MITKPKHIVCGEEQCRPGWAEPTPGAGYWEKSERSFLRSSLYYYLSAGALIAACIVGCWWIFDR